MVQSRDSVMPRGSRCTYHVISCCARRAYLLGDDYRHRRDWVAELLADLLSGFAIDLQAYAIMSNHIHLVLRPRPDVIAEWDAAQVSRSGLRMTPVRMGGPGNPPIPVTADMIDQYADLDDWVAEYRDRLSSISWFMKVLKQRIARRANAEDRCTGHFWEGRFQTVPLLDMGAVFTCMAYVDRNPLRAGMAKTIAQCRYTSAAQRLVRAKQLAPARFTKAELALGRQLISLSQCPPLESWPDDGEQTVSSLRLDDYCSLITGPVADALCARLGVNGTAWKSLLNEPGLFQGVGVGGRASRMAFAREQGKRTLADKTKIWLDADVKN